jgi:hypothetical protein
MMAHFITLYRREKKAIELDILPAEIEEKKLSIGYKEQ